MKALAELTIVALIGTFTIVAGILIPPSVIKTTIAKEQVLAYKFETAQHGLLSLLSSTQDGRSVYELFGTKILLGDSISISTTVFDTTIRLAYCILVNPQVVGAERDVLKDVPSCEVDAIFNTLVVVPYNKKSLVEVIGMGVK